MFLHPDLSRIPRSDSLAPEPAAPLSTFLQWLRNLLSGGQFLFIEMTQPQPNNPPVKLRALVAEDDPPTQDLITTVLRRVGFEVDAVNHGRAAIEKLKTVGYALVILDLRMPNVDGAGVLEFVKANRPATLKRIVVTSALSPSEIQRHCDADVCSILQKPFDVVRLAEIARECAEVCNAPAI